MIIKTRGIIFRTVKYSETSYIADIYTEEKGLRSYIISGVRKKKATVSQSLLQVMSLVDLVAYERKGKDINRIKEIRPAYIFQEIPFSIYKSAVGLFLIELCSKSVKEAGANPELFAYIFNSFQFLDQSPDSISRIPLVFMTELSGFLGFQPRENYSKAAPFFDLKEGLYTNVPSHGSLFLDENLSEKFFRLTKSSLSLSHELELSKKDRKVLLEKLISYYQLHVEGLKGLNAHKILEEVLE